MQARQKILAALVLALATAACGEKQPGATGPDGPGGPGGPGGSGGAPSVTVATPLVKPIVDWDDYVGRFEARQSVEVRPRVSGLTRR